MFKYQNLALTNGHGNIYFNFQCDVDREKANILVGEINTTVDVKSYDSLGNRILDFIVNAGPQKTKENRIK